MFKYTIEDSFDAATKAIKLDGKSFGTANDFDSSMHYGKSAFAYKVVQPKASSIDFSGFRPLLARVEAVIKEHAKRVAAQKAKPRSP